MTMASWWDGTLASRLQRLPERSGRPPVFFNEGSVQELRRRAGPGDPVWDTIHRDAQSAASDPLSQKTKENEPDAGALGLAFAYTVWPQADLLSACIERLERALDAPTWVARFHRGLRVDLRSAVMCSSLALVFDLVESVLPPVLRDRLLRAVEERVLIPFAQIVRDRSEWWTVRRMNWQAVINGHVGLALLALREHVGEWRSRLALATAGVVDFLDGCPRDGSFPEGMTYWHYGIGELAWFALGLKTVSAGEINLFEHPYLRATQDFPVHMSTPDGCFDFDDCCNFRPNTWLVALLAREYRNSVLQGMVARHGLEPGPPRKVDAPARGMRFVLSHDESLQAASISSMPTSRFFPEIDAVVMRSDWSAEATVVALKGGRNDVPHGHLDAGSFIIGHAGRKAVPDGGFWRYTTGFFDYERRRWDFDGASTLAHNLLLVNGRGQGSGAEACATIKRVELGGSVEWLVCDITAAYEGRLSRFIRFVAFRKPSTVVVLDDIAADCPSSFKWLLQYRDSAQFTQGGWRLRSNGVSAHVSFPILEGPYIVTDETRHSHYVPNVDTGRPHVIRFASLAHEGLRAHWRVLAVIDLGEPMAEAACGWEAQDCGQLLHVRGRETRDVLTFDLGAQAVAAVG
jgi:hypothetical protein